MGVESRGVAGPIEDIWLPYSEEYSHRTPSHISKVDNISQEWRPTGLESAASGRQGKAKGHGGALARPIACYRSGSPMRFDDGPRDG